jgi:hypothetical protein
MISALALLIQSHALFTILGEGAILFAVFMIGAVVPWIGKPISTKRYIAISALCITAWVLVAAAFAVKG